MSSRPQKQRFERIFGRRSVLEALSAERREIFRLYLRAGLKGSTAEEILAIAQKKGIEIAEADLDQLEKWSKGAPHQGVAAQVSPLPDLGIEELLAAAEQKGEPPFLIALDKIEDPMNAGAILRSACAAGCHGAVMLNSHAVPLSGVVARASAGAIEHLPIAQVPNLHRTLEALKDEGVWVVGADMAGEKNLWKTDLDRPVCLVIGSEGRGLRELTRKSCDMLVQIPMRGPIGSLNASVSAGVLLFEVLRQRGGK